MTISREDFVQETERGRAHCLRGDAADLRAHQSIRAVVEPAVEELRPLTPQERALVHGTRRRTFRMVEEKLRRDGDPAADPSLAD